MKRLIMLILLTATTAKAQWDGPWADKTNYTFYGIESRYGPISQMWYAVGERMEVERGQNATPGITFVWEDTAGTNTVIYTNAAGRPFTNYVLAVRGFTNALNIANPTNRDIISGIEYTYTDSNGTTTATTRMPYVTGMGEYGPNFRVQGILPYLDYVIFNNVDDFGDKIALNEWVNTNLSDGGDFNEYFAQGVGGAYPSVFPTYNYASLQYYEGYGFGTNYTTNIWGDITGSSVTSYTRANAQSNMAWFTVYPSNDVNWELAYATSDGTNWAFREIMVLGTNETSDLNTLGAYCMEPQDLPVLLYQHSTNDIVARDVTITGQAYKAEIQSSYRFLETTSETISSTGTNACTKQWYKITSITPDGAANKYDSYAVVYTNEMAMYGEPEEWTRLYSVMLDERWHAFHALLWSDVAEPDTTIDWEAVVANNQYEWEGTGATWAAAKSAAEAATPTVSTVDSLPGSWTKGQYVDPGGPPVFYRAWAFARASYPVVQGNTVSTNYARKVEFYFDGRAEGEWDAQGYDIKDGILSNLVDSGVGIDYAITSAAPVNVTNFPPNWCAEPDAGQAFTTNGWFQDREQGLIRWDVTDATHPEFRYQNE